ncbi:hypothetical protein COL154_014154, partial [Colletotrichum chrysophilum]
MFRGWPQRSRHQGCHLAASGQGAPPVARPRTLQVGALHRELLLRAQGVQAHRRASRQEGSKLRCM